MNSARKSYSGIRQFRHSDKPPLTFSEELDLAETRLPSTFGRYAGMTLDEVARRPKGLAMLRFVSRGTFRDPLLATIRRYLETINPIGVDIMDDTRPEHVATVLDEQKGAPEAQGAGHERAAGVGAANQAANDRNERYAAMGAVADEAHREEGRDA